MSRFDREDFTQGQIKGEISKGEILDDQAARDPKTARSESVQKALRTDARTARQRSQEQGRHRRND